MMRARVRSQVVVVACSGLLFAQAAAAEGAPPAPLAQSLSGEAKSDYDSGRLLFEDGDSRGALAKFSHSYALSHDARLLWNMATCEKELRHYARAAMLVGRYLREGGSRIPAEQRQDALDTQKALRAFYVELKLSGVPEGATVLIDGVSAGQFPSAEPLLLDLGTRTLPVVLPGFEPYETKLEVAGGGELKLTVKLKRSPAAGPARLRVVTAGAKDSVAVDGKVVGWQSWEGPLAAGEHVVRVTAAQKKPYEAHFTLLPSARRSLQITLEDERQGSNLWLWVAGGVAVAAGAAVGGYFLLRPQDAPGAHPEGKLATVYLSLGKGR